jgi:hypothetical protein
LKRVFDRKIYDTETAEEIAFWSNGCNRSDFHFCEETLFRTPKGEFFLYGYGGSLSCYARSCGTNSWCGGESICPLTSEQAIDWLERTQNVEALETLFLDQLEEA